MIEPQEDEKYLKYHNMADALKKKERTPRTTMHSQMQRAADELRHEGKGSEDPMYNSSKKNK